MSQAQLAAVQKSHHFQMPPNNKGFVGRQRFLETAESLYRNAANLSRNMEFCIVGPGGIGKTSFVIAFLYQWFAKCRYQQIIWLHAEFEHQLLLQLQALVKQWYQLDIEDMRSLNENDYIRMFYDHLSLKETTETTCIIVDNAENVKAVKPYLPQQNLAGNRIDILVTSRNMEWLTEFQPNAVEMHAFSACEVMEYLQEELPSYMLSDIASEPSRNTQMATRLNNVLGGLPLAIVQAVAYSKLNGLSIDEYCKILDKTPAFEASHDKNMLSVQHTVTMAIDKVRKKCCAVDTVVSICAYLATDHITKDLLCSIIPFRYGMPDLSDSEPSETASLFASTPKTNENTAPDDQQIAQDQKIDINDPCRMASCSKSSSLSDKYISDLTTPTKSGHDEVKQLEMNVKEASLFHEQSENERKLNVDKLNMEQEDLHLNYIVSSALVEEALGLLSQYSIVSLAGSTIRIHRLTQAVMRDIHTKNNLYKKTYLHVLNYLLPNLEYDERDKADIARVSALIPHGLYLPKLQHQFLSDSETTLLLQLWFKIGRHQLFGVGNPIVAVKCYKKVIKSRLPIDDDFVIADTLGNLSNAYGELGYYEKQREIMTRTLAIFENYEGSDHPSTAQALMNLGIVHGSLGNYEKQLELINRALVIKEAHFGPDHRQTGIALDNLGNAYGEMGDYKKKRDLLIRALAISEAYFGANHPSTAQTLMNLGTTYGVLGDYKQQYDLITRAAEMKEAHFGPNNAQTGIALHNLATVYGNLGNYEKQTETLNRALEILNVCYSPHHPLTATTLGNLGTAYGNLGDHEKQRDLLHRALLILETHYGRDHPKTSSILNNLGVAYGELADCEKQREFLKRALTIREAFYGQEHPKTAETLTNLAAAYEVANDYEKQRQLLTRALAIFEAHYGINHPQTGIVVGNLGVVYGNLGENVKQRDLLLRALAISEMHCDPNHLQTAITLENLANAYGQLGDFEKQRQLLTRALDVFKKQRGSAHPQTAATLSNLGVVHGKLGNNEIQRDMLARALAIFEENFGADHPQTVTAIENLASAYGQLGQHEKQRDFLTRALTIREAHFGPSHPTTLMTLSSLGIAHGKLGDHSKKQELLTRALEMQAVLCSAERFQMASTLLVIARVHFRYEHFAEAYAYVRRSRAILANLYGADHLLTKQADGLIQRYLQALLSRRGKMR